MDLMKLGTQMLLSKISGGNSGNAMSALSGLLGNNDGGLDLGSIVSKMQGGDMANIASSWLGKGSNESIGTDQLRSMFGDDKISQFASQLGTDEDSALSGLSEALPNMVDQASPDGSLLDSLGGIGGLASMASKFLK
ncbi:MAG TPA: DUF937 domain-containing protein [Chromatiales bacterium]|nr:DUF937 domain-containing protein [Thiotrichales bacterium]HIP69298.1 DUF937 domain-containing protein [Chromatiales bacterium]